MMFSNVNTMVPDTIPTHFLHSLQWLFICCEK